MSNVKMFKIKITNYSCYIPPLLLTIQVAPTKKQVLRTLLEVQRFHKDQLQARFHTSDKLLCFYTHGQPTLNPSRPKDPFCERAHHDPECAEAKGQTGHQSWPEIDHVPHAGTQGLPEGSRTTFVARKRHGSYLRTMWD
jgi:hypothetical protein